MNIAQFANSFAAQARNAVRDLTKARRVSFSQVSAKEELVVVKADRGVAKALRTAALVQTIARREIAEDKKAGGKAIVTRHEPGNPNKVFRTPRVNGKVVSHAKLQQALAAEKKELSPREHMLAASQARRALRHAAAEKSLPVNTQYYVVDETRKESVIVRGPFKTKSAAEAVKRPDSARGTVYQVVLTGSACRNEGLLYSPKFVDERTKAKPEVQQAPRAKSSRVASAPRKHNLSVARKIVRAA